MISYELVMGLTLLGLILIYGTVDLNEIVRSSRAPCWGVLPAWGIVLQPFAAILFLVAAIAENKRIPFDLPEAESELIAGYFTEYSGDEDGPVHVRRVHRDRDHRRAVHDAVPRRLQPALHDRRRLRFPGGPHVVAMSHGAVVVTQLVVFLAKVFVLCSFQILVRWSLPRFRYDQVLRFAWKFMLPLALANLVVTVVVCGRSESDADGKNAPYVRKQYWNEPTMGWWERAYLFEIVRGLGITGGVFLRNMGKWMTGRKGALTTYYPEEKRCRLRAGNRGKHVLTQREDGSPQCIACNMCATVCPAKVIEIEAGFDPADTAHPKFPARFEIDYSRCVFCGLCVEACPEDAIRMVKDVPRPAVGRPERMWLGKEELLTWQPQSDVAKPYPANPPRWPGERHDGCTARQPGDAAACAVRRLCADRRRARCSCCASRCGWRWR
jgi:NADH-quinone oxidoreductase subunit I